jgi:LmbE family N-acetylglucosaminyl deacetylase
VVIDKERGLMKRLLSLFLLVALPQIVFGQATPVTMALRPADDRFKADIMVVVAHPDDEGAFTPYLARAVYDLHKRVAVVYGTHGGSGGNSYGKERAGALAEIRELEARQACARLGITNVWFLDGKDTASQNVLNSLANWGHGENLERLVRLIRLTRPDVLMTSLPGVFIGEDHGDHQAAGVLTIEAFDLANDPTVFPAQLAAAMPKREIYEENLNPWQPKKLYFFADAQDDGLFKGKGPSYSIKEVSPSQKKPYWRLAIDAALTHLTQYPDEIHALEKLTDAELEKRMSDPDTGWWSEPETLIFGKSYYVSKPTDDVFANLDGEVAACDGYSKKTERPGSLTSVRLGGPWGYYDDFRREHCLTAVPQADPPEVGIKSGTPLSVPIDVVHDVKRPLTIDVSVDAPSGWKLSGGGRYVLPQEDRTTFRVEVETPTLTDAQLRAAKPALITVHVKEGDKTLKDIPLKVLLRNSGLPQ